MLLTNLIYYDLKVAALIGVFYLFYRLLLARETMHTLNRTVLLVGIALSTVLPLCIITLHRTVVVEGGLQPVLGDTAVGDAASPYAADALQRGFDWSIPLAVVVLAGTVVRLLFVVRSYRRLKSIMRNGEMHTLSSGTRVCAVEAPVAPFSWMQTIVLSRSDWQSQSESIFAHEEAHVRHRHSYDVVIVEVLTALQWFNPVVWFLRQELRTLHEYEADASVLSRGFDESQYIHLLMQKATGIQACALANGINTHKTKKRIIMMLKPKSKRSAWFKALYIVPVALASLAMTAKTVTDYETTPAAEPVVRMFTDTGHGRGDCYQIRHQPGVKFFHNGREETIPNGRSIALEVSKTTMLLNGNPIDQITLLDLPAQLKEIHLTEVNPDQFELNMVTEIPSRKTVLIVNDEVVSEDVVNSIVKEDVVNVDVISNKEFCRKYDAEAENVVLIRTKQSDDDPVFEVCEQLPQFLGGEAKLMEFLMRNMRYPQIAKDNGVQGRVLAQFIVEKDGTLSNVKILDSPQGSGVAMVTVVATMSEEERQKAENHNVGVQALRDEAVRVINAMPKWTPGKQRGQTVRAKFTIPVTFRLN